MMSHKSHKPHESHESHGSHSPRQKGQFNMEYFVSMIIFLTFTLYLAFRLVDFYPRYIQDVKGEILRSDAYRLSEMIVNDDGSPADWDTAGSPDRIGLSDQSQNKSNMLSVSKINEMQSLCAADYSSVRDLVGSANNFYMTVEDMYGPLSMQCGMLPSAENVAIITRVVALDNGNYGKVTIQVW